MPRPRPSISIALLAMCAMALVSSCGGEITLPEYAEQVEAVITEMNDELSVLDAAVASAASLEDLQGYARDRSELRHTLLDDLSDIEPPDAVVDLHFEALEAIGDLVDAEDVLVAKVLAADTAAIAAAVWETPEGAAARAADARTIKLCVAAQETFDRTQAGEEFADVPWIPDEMKQVIRVALGCHAEDR